MKVLVVGGCGFVGSSLVRSLKEHSPSYEIIVMDNLSRRGSELNLALLKKEGVPFFHGDTRSVSDVFSLPELDWVIDCAANPSVIAGVDGRVSSEQLIEHNLKGTLNLLELCRVRKAGFIFMSTSRVYSCAALNELFVHELDSRFIVHSANVPGVSTEGTINEFFPTRSPLSLYGASKLASEVIAMEYGGAFNFPVHVNRCGVIAGPGQFGKADQGFFSYWIYQYLLDRPLTYIGYGAKGLQVRDVIHPSDVAQLVQIQISNRSVHTTLVNVGGGPERSISLKELSSRCESAMGRHKGILTETRKRPFDIPYYVSDTTLARTMWGWQPRISLDEIFEATRKWAVENLSFIRDAW